jgi:hypothetical protein
LGTLLRQLSRHGPTRLHVDPLEASMRLLLGALSGCGAAVLDSDLWSR